MSAIRLTQISTENLFCLLQLLLIEVGVSLKIGGSSLILRLPGNKPSPTDPGNDNGKTTPPPSEDENDGTDYDAIRKLIESYKRKISELEKLLPENK